MKIFRDKSQLSINSMAKCNWIISITSWSTSSDYLRNTVEVVTLAHWLLWGKNIDLVSQKRSCGFCFCWTHRNCCVRHFRTGFSPQLRWLPLGWTKWIYIGAKLQKHLEIWFVLGQVRRIGAASKTKPLYVPATYVTEVPIAPMPSPQRLVMSASLNSNLRILPRVALTPSPTETPCNEQHQGNVWEEDRSFEKTYGMAFSVALTV